MEVTIKSFDVKMEVKNKGIEFEVRAPGNKDHLGDIVLNKTGLTWCKGKTTPANGIKVTFAEFIKWAEQKTAKKNSKVARKNGKGGSIGAPLQ